VRRVVDAVVAFVVIGEHGRGDGAITAAMAR
jgi:hypothetical protein